ncbi:hypothetical protein FYJ44_05880 [Desulfovibrio sp. PG-178-WT-4]|uniref:Uncharacterized protein n=1 Tax=Desulfovibrio porci TaxID=2605782 RepID=A0A6L5XK98_9BACT|nr:hypothetical protein [Desulfovibrio porci]MSS27587.1 hypothetical protein [Desulfovibrio porci]
MFEQEKIAVSRLRQAYNLSATEADNLVLSLWPSKAFPLELWQEAHETYWRSFAERNASLYGLEIPSLPEVGDAQTFNSYLLSCDVMLFFQKLSRCIHVHALELGLRHILENSHDEPDAVFPEERQTLLNALSKSLGYQPVEYDQSMRKEDDGFQEDSPAFIPVSYYHIISRIFLNTILVDRTAAIRLLHEYPWQEVKGLTRAVVEAALKPDSSSSSLPPVESNPSAETVTEVLAEDGKLVFRVPAALWQGKPDPAVRDAMKASYPRAVIAYVLLHWCGPGSPGPDHKTPQGRKTHVGRLLAEKEYRDEKSYRNQVDTLLKEADAYTILQA